MGMIVNPFEFGIAPGTLLVGFDGAPNADTAISGNTSTGSAFQAVRAGLATTINIRGHSGTGNGTTAFYLCVYGATSESVWGGALLAQSAIQAPLNQSELRSAALVVPLSIVLSNYYALTVLPNDTMFHAAETGLSVNNRGFSDTYADGPAATAGALGLNGSQAAAIWLSA